MEMAPGDGVSEMDQKVFALHNQIRADPKSVIPDLEKMLEQFEGNLLRRPGQVTLRTKEGQAAVKEAIEFLKKQQPVEALRWSEDVAKAAKDHFEDIGPKGLIQHEGSDGKTTVK